jgi:hypothetical protein
MRRTVSSSRRRSGFVVALTVVGTIVVLIAAASGAFDSGSGTNKSTVVQPAASGPVMLSTDPHQGNVGVVDSRGTTRGYVPANVLDAAPTVTLPGQDQERRPFMAKAVLSLDGSGTIVGYLVGGQLGFVDATLARDGAQLTQLNACEYTYTHAGTADDSCKALMTTQGIQVFSR